tara:strand:- start:6309 stop:6533 length:225 start_codon:yes stop_codon:yes gene_type:complete
MFSRQKYLDATATSFSATHPFQRMIESHSKNGFIVYNQILDEIIANSPRYLTKPKYFGGNRFNATGLTDFRLQQ